MKSLKSGRCRVGTNGSIISAATVTAEATGNFVGPPPAQMTFELSRPAINSEAIVVGDLVAGSSPPRYEFLWLVRQEKGRWQIKLRGYRSNTVGFKIDKRKQIVEVVNSWAGAPKGSAGGGTFCDDLVRYIYGFVGLTLSAPPSPDETESVTNLWSATNTAAEDTQQGSIVFYQFPNDTRWRHAGVNTGGQIVDQNCGLEHDRVDSLTIGQHSTDHPDLLVPAPGRYVPPSYHSTTELQNLDDE